MKYLTISFPDDLPQNSELQFRIHLNQSGIKFLQHPFSILVHI